MSWLKSLIFKHVLNVLRAAFAPLMRRCSGAFKWNQTTKTVAGLSASVFSMMALLSFFGSLEQSAVSPEAETISADLGAGDELSLEFGLDAALPLRDSETALSGSPDYDNPISPSSVIRTVSVEQAAGTDLNAGGVYHAVGQQQAGQRVVPVAGEYPVYLSRERQPGSPVRPADEGAAWLTGEIEEVDDLPVNGSFRQLRNQ